MLEPFISMRRLGHGLQVHTGTKSLDQGLGVGAFIFSPAQGYQLLNKVGMELGRGAEAIGGGFERTSQLRVIVEDGFNGKGLSPD